MQSKWGTYPWFIEYGIDQIHPDDVDGFRKIANNCRVFECTNVDEQYITLKYSDNYYRVKKDRFTEIPPPKFGFGQRVLVNDNSNQEAVISDIMWHYNNKEPYYFVIVNGKQKSKRYLEVELKEL